MVHKNSLTVYKKIVLPDVRKKHETIIKAIAELGEATSYEIAEYINKPVHVFSGRLTELSGTTEYDKPIIEQVGIRPNKYGNSCAIWRIKQYQVELKQAELFG